MSVEDVPEIKASEFRTPAPADRDPFWTQGERRLLMAILEHALMDLRHPETRKEVEDWVFDPDATETDPFTLPWICLWLDSCPESFRKQAQRVLNGERIVGHNLTSFGKK